MKHFACFTVFAILLLCSSAAVMSRPSSIDELERSTKKQVTGKKQFRSEINTQKASSGAFSRGKLAKKKGDGKPIPSMRPVRKATERKKLRRPVSPKKGIRTKKVLSKLAKNKVAGRKGSRPAPLKKNDTTKKVPFGKIPADIKLGNAKRIRTNKVMRKLRKKGIVSKNRPGPKPSVMSGTSKKLPLRMKPTDTKPQE